MGSEATDSDVECCNAHAEPGQKQRNKENDRSNPGDAVGPTPAGGIEFVRRNRHSRRDRRWRRCGSSWRPVHRGRPLRRGRHGRRDGPTLGAKRPSLGNFTLALRAEPCHGKPPQSWAAATATASSTPLIKLSHFYLSAYDPPKFSAVSATERSGWWHHGAQSLGGLLVGSGFRCCGDCRGSWVGDRCVRRSRPICCRRLQRLRDTGWGDPAAISEGCGQGSIGPSSGTQGRRHRPSGIRHTHG